MSQSDRCMSANEDLSALMDGEVGESELARACSQWRDDADARASWHAYHLIGDVLRSDDLAASPARDAAFLAALQVRLSNEPIVIAPQAAQPAGMPARRPRRRHWATGAAIAAGFFVVAGTLVATQMPDGLGSSDAPAGAAGLAQIAEAPAGNLVAVSGPAASAAGDPPMVVLDGQLIRDVRLDEYLAAHKKFGGSSAPGGPSGFLRNAAADGSAR